jgi:hypothetical protein
MMKNILIISFLFALSLSSATTFAQNKDSTVIHTDESLSPKDSEKTPCDTSSLQRTSDVCIINNTHYLIVSLYARESSVNGWLPGDEDLLSFGTIIYPGQSRLVHINNDGIHCNYNVYIVMRENVHHIYYGQNICDINSLTLTKW